MDEFIVTYLDGKKMEISHSGLRLVTDQAVEDGGEGIALSPFDLFLASILSCSGMVVLSFLKKRGIDPKGLQLKMQPDYKEEENVVTSLKIVIDTPKDFPVKYRSALEKVLDVCTVKKHILNPPEFIVEVSNS